MDTWTNELPRLRRICDNLYEQAKTAQTRGEYDRAQRRLGELRRAIAVLDREWKDYGLEEASKTAKRYLK